MWSSTKIAVRVTLVTLVLAGVLYPLGMTALAQLFFHSAANGSLIADGSGRIVGSALIGQRFTSAAYFQPRPSAAGSNGYDGTASGGSNLGPTSGKLKAQVQASVARLRMENPDAQPPVPTDLVSMSASGLDPHVSPAGAFWQAPRVAKARGVAVARIRALVEALIEPRDLGFLGEPRVNVLHLNLALDRQFGRPRPRGSE